MQVTNNSFGIRSNRYFSLHMLLRKGVLTLFNLQFILSLNVLASLLPDHTSAFLFVSLISCFLLLPPCASLIWPYLEFWKPSALSFLQYSSVISSTWIDSAVIDMLTFSFLAWTQIPNQNPSYYCRLNVYLPIPIPSYIDTLNPMWLYLEMGSLRNLRLNEVIRISALIVLVSL